jgi:twinkle protein
LNVIPDNFDFKGYQWVANNNQDVVKTTQLDLVAAFHSKEPKGDTLPWSKTHADVQLRPSEVTVWPGISGHGKSLVTTQVAFHLAFTGKRVAIVSLEMRPVTTMARMARMASASEVPSVQWLEGFKGWGNDKIFLMGTQGIVQPKRVLDFVNYTAKAAGCTHVFIDNLTKVVRNEDDHNGQKSFVDDLCTIARDRRIHVHLVAHTRKGQTEYEMPDKFDVRGSASIVDQVDNVITVWRHKKKEDELMKPGLDPIKRADWESRPDTVLIVAKQRNGDWEGKVGLHVHRASMWFNERPGMPHPMPKLFDIQEKVSEEVPF